MKIRFMAPFLIFVLCSFTGIAQERRGDQKGDEELIQGAWEIAAIWDYGREDTSNRNIILVFDKGEIIGKRGGEGIAIGSYKLDPIKRPGWIDLTVGDATFLGIYKFENGQLVICQGRENRKVRSTEFVSQPNDYNSTLTIFRRVKSEPGTGSGSATQSQARQADDLEQAKRLDDEARRLYDLGKYDEAITIIKRALEIREKVLGPNHPDVAESLGDLAGLYETKGDYAEAEPLVRRALEIHEKALGPDHAQVATDLNILAAIYKAKGDYAKAESLCQRALGIREKAFGPDHPNVAFVLTTLADIYYAKRDYAQAKSQYQRALRIFEKTLGPNSQEAVSIRHKLEQLSRTKEDKAQAAPPSPRAPAIQEKTPDPDLLNLLTSLGSDAMDYYEQGEYVRAEPLLLRALPIAEKVFGPDHPNVASQLHILALVYYQLGDYAKAEPRFQRALEIREKALGPDHPQVAATVYLLAMLYDKKGDYAKGLSFHERALDIDKRALGPNHPNVAADLNALGFLFFKVGDYKGAERFYLQSLAILVKAFGPDHLNVAVDLHDLGILYSQMRDYGKAEQFLQRTLEIREKALGPNHPDVGATVNNLGSLNYRMGDYAKAEQFLLRSLAIAERVLGPDHPDIASNLGNLARLYEARGDVRQAVAYYRRATDISERNIALNLATGSERQKSLYLATLEAGTNLIVSLHVQSAPNDSAARRLALTIILRRKGRALDATADILAALQRHFNPQDRALLDQLTDTRSRLATLVLGGLGKAEPAQYRAAITRLEEQADQLEAQISARSAEFRAQSQPVTLEAVQAAIPADAALIEFVSYSPYDVKKNEWGSRGYVAYVLGNQGEPAWVNLGEAAEIDKLVNQLRAALRKDEAKPLSDIERELKPAARLLDQKIMQPVRKLLGNKRRLLVSPDGALNLIPFAALVDEQGQYLIESYSLSYLTTGRDLLRLQTRMDNKQVAAVFANPDFGANQKTGSGRILQEEAKPKTPPGNHAEPDNAPQAFDFSRAYFSALPGTADEAQALKTIFPGAKVWTARQATKTELKQVNAPVFLHIATHGFFLDDLIVSAAEAKNRGLFIRTNQPGEIDPREFHVEDPLLRSGLAFAGANFHRTADDNGILTAKEASGLNLWGTKLVVLSACDTGVGEVKNGEGVYGLRRALVLAGSESQVMSLWPVSDAGTRDLMIEYYQRLQAGGGRSEALRQVQLGMLKSRERKHPYYWASFIQSGEWANLDGKR